MVVGVAVCRVFFFLSFFLREASAVYKFSSCELMTRQVVQVKAWGVKAEKEEHGGRAKQSNKVQ